MTIEEEADKLFELLIDTLNILKDECIKLTPDAKKEINRITFECAKLVRTNTKNSM